MTLVLHDAAVLDLTDWIRPGDGIVWGQACAEPTTLTARLAEQAGQLGPVSVFIGMTLADGWDPAATPDIDVVSYCASGRNRLWREAGHVEVLSAHYSALPGYFRRGLIRSDVVLLSVGPAGADGRWSLGLADEYLSGALDAARVVIVEVSPHVPRIPGGRTLGPEDVDVVVHGDREPVSLPVTESSPVEQALAVQVASLVPDGATLQIGLGSFPGAVLAQLRERNDLGVHSGLISDGVAELVERGVVTNALKPRDRGVTVGGVVMGTRRVFDWVHDNPAVALRDTDYTHDPGLLASLPLLVAINSGIEVDLTGQVNTEVAAGRYVGAVGGVLDFLRGAHRSDGGVPIVALPAATRGMTRIVTTLSGPVTIGRADVGVVVTEYGSADLRGLPLAERRERLLAIAHPDHRDRLRYGEQ